MCEASPQSLRAQVKAQQGFTVLDKKKSLGWGAMDGALLHVLLSSPLAFLQLYL